MTWLVALIVVIAGASWLAVTSFRRASYPVATGMPSPPTQSLADILRQLDSRIEGQSPKRFAALRSGLGRDELLAIEEEYGFRLTDEIRELYAWHDGIALDSGQSFFGIHEFVPLEHLAKTELAKNQELASATVLQRSVYWAFCGHRKNWIELFPDGAGDGYFVDPTRNPNQGAVFYSFNETGDYRFYASLSSLMLAISDCYDAGLYDGGRDSSSVSEIEREVAIHEKHGASKSVTIRRNRAAKSGVLEWPIDRRRRLIGVVGCRSRHARRITDRTIRIAARCAGARPAQRRAVSRLSPCGGAIADALAASQQPASSAHAVS